MITVLTCALSVLAVTARPVAAQTKGAADVRAAFGSIDLQKAFNDYKQKQQLSQDIQDYGANLDKVVRRLSNSPFLSDVETRELGTLYEKATPTDADRQRIAALEKKVQDTSGEMTTLQNVTAPNDQQKARLTELTTLREKGAAVFQTVQQEYRQRLDARQAELSQKVTEAIRIAVAKVAQEKNLAVVFDSAVAIYSANDITADVIKQLNK